MPDPSTARPPIRFRDTALASGLLEGAQIEAAESEVRRVVHPEATEPADWDRAVAESLVARGLLTKFQAREMLAGRTRFRLGQYTVLDEIGRGGMGQVFRAEHAMMGREVALKVLPRAKSTPEYEAAFKREIRMLARLDHENLVRALDAGHDAKVYYLVTELVAGLDLRKQVIKFGPLDEMAAAAVISQAARGLSYAHEHGLVHRDVKPGNLLVTQDGRVKVLDLGLAGSTLDPDSIGSGRVVGTIDYMAPEQIRTPDAVTPAADVYSLGCTMYFALSGQVPFPGGSRKEKAQRQLCEQPVPLAQLAPHVDPNIRQVVQDMMHKSPADRIGTAAEVIRRLQPWTPRSPVPMSRTPAAAGTIVLDHGPVPPPLPAAATVVAGREPTRVDSSSGLSGLGAWAAGDDDWSTPVASRMETVDDGLLAALTVMRDTAWRLWAARITALRSPAGRRMARKWAVAAAFAVVAGVVFGWVMRQIKDIDAERFDDALFGMSPAMLGGIVGAALFGLQAAGLAGQRRGR